MKRIVDVPPGLLQPYMEQIRHKVFKKVPISWANDFSSICTSLEKGSNGYQLGIGKDNLARKYIQVPSVLQLRFDANLIQMPKHDKT